MFISILFLSRDYSTVIQEAREDVEEGMLTRLGIFYAKQGN